MSKHTPTPWKIVRPRSRYEQDCGILADGGVIAETFCRIHAADVIEPEIALSNAEFIVTACNAYDDNQQTITAQAAEIERLLEVERENALKLKQILDLEETLYATRIINMNDGSPCWCVFPSFESGPHSDYCAKAREATEAMWKHKSLQPQEAAPTINPETPCACGSTTFVYLQSGKRLCVVCQK